MEGGGSRVGVHLEFDSGLPGGPGVWSVEREKVVERQRVLERVGWECWRFSGLRWIVEGEEVWEELLGFLKSKGVKAEEKEEEGDEGGKWDAGGGGDGGGGEEGGDDGGRGDSVAHMVIDLTEEADEADGATEGDGVDVVDVVVIKSDDEDDDDDDDDDIDPRMFGEPVALSAIAGCSSSDLDGDILRLFSETMAGGEVGRQSKRRRRGERDETYKPRGSDDDDDDDDDDEF